MACEWIAGRQRVCVPEFRCDGDRHCLCAWVPMWQRQALFVCLSSDVKATGTVCVPEFRCDSDRHCLCAWVPMWQSQALFARIIALTQRVTCYIYYLIRCSWHLINNFKVWHSLAVQFCFITSGFGSRQSVERGSAPWH